MNSEQELFQKLAMSKKIMDRHNEIGRGQAKPSIDHSSPILEDYQPINASYNLPDDLLMEQNNVPKTSQSGPPTKDRILNSKLPDEIKQLMIEHPIDQPKMGASSGSVLSDELVERASRLMNVNAKGDVIKESTKRSTQQQSNLPNFSKTQFKDLIRETLEEVLNENGLLVESETKSNEVFKFRLGDHIFEGKLTKVKKVQK
jgi:hypothetical protein